MKRVILFFYFRWQIKNYRWRIHQRGISIGDVVSKLITDGICVLHRWKNSVGKTIKSCSVMKPNSRLTKSHKGKNKKESLNKKESTTANKRVKMKFNKKNKMLMDAIEKKIIKKITKNKKLTINKWGSNFTNKKIKGWWNWKKISILWII